MRVSTALIVMMAASLATLSPAGAAEPEHILFRAVRDGNHQLLHGLLREATPVDLRAADGSTPLMIAALWGDASSVELLIEHDANPNLKNRQGVTALVWGAGDAAKVKLLLQAGADSNAATDLGNTPLMIAAAQPAGLESMRLLLSAGADPHAKNKRGFTALRGAVSTGDAAAVELLLAHGAEVDARQDTTSDLSIAAGRGNQQIVELLIEHGADPNTGQGRSALNAALLAQKPKIAARLIQRGAELDRELRPGDVPSFVLSAYNEYGDTTISQLMIEQGADIKAANRYHETAVSWARKRGAVELIKILSEAGVPEGALKTKLLPHRDVQLQGQNAQPLIGGAIRSSISLLQHSSDVFLEKRENCVSCHHQNLPSLAIGWARDRGFAVDDDSIQRMIDAQLRSWRPRLDRAYQMDRPVPVAPRFIGYGLLGFAALGYVPDEVTAAMVWYLAAIQQADGRWEAGMLRPPLGGADVVATVLAMRSLQLYSPPGRRTEARARVARARAWLCEVKPRIHQERVYRLLGLAWSGTASTELSSSVDELLREQRDDGGWAQLPGLDSDAWATGQTLVALHHAGLATDQHAYRRGIQYLLRTQFEDGSWYVRTRTWPFQSHFDSQFPHGKDQWVSAPATAWASLALLLAVDPASSSDGVDQTLNASVEPGTTKAAAVDSRPVAPPRQDAPVDFERQIKPILTRSCLGCHSGAQPKGRFRLSSRARLLRGGQSGSPAVVPGRSAESLLLQLVSDEIEDLEMPPLSSRDKFPALNRSERELLRGWIEQGASWPPGLELGK